MIALSANEWKYYSLAIREPHWNAPQRAAHTRVERHLRVTKVIETVIAGGRTARVPAVGVQRVAKHARGRRVPVVEFMSNLNET